MTAKEFAAKKDSETAKRAINVAGLSILCGCVIVLAIAFAIHPIAGGAVLAFFLFSLAKILGQVAQELRGNKPNPKVTLASEASVDVDRVVR